MKNFFVMMLLSATLQSKNFFGKSFDWKGESSNEELSFLVICTYFLISFHYCISYIFILSQYYFENFSKGPHLYFSQISRLSLISLYCKLSVIRETGKAQNGGHNKTKHAKFSEKQTFLTPWHAQVRKEKFRRRLISILNFEEYFKVVTLSLYYRDNNKNSKILKGLFSFSDQPWGSGFPTFLEHVP